MRVVLSSYILWRSVHITTMGHTSRLHLFFVLAKIDFLFTLFNMSHSIKPFLLQSILAWAETNRWTVLLIVKPHPNHQVPDEIIQVSRAVFNVGQKAVEQREITHTSISFLAHMNAQTHLTPIDLAVEGWVGVKIKENNVTFDLSFEEHPHDLFNAWPNGILLSPLSYTEYAKGHEVSSFDRSLDNGCSTNVPHTNGPRLVPLRDTLKRSHLRLVINNDVSATGT